MEGAGGGGERGACAPTPVGAPISGWDRRTWRRRTPELTRNLSASQPGSLVAAPLLRTSPHAHPWSGVPHNTHTHTSCVRPEDEGVGAPPVRVLSPSSLSDMKLMSSARSRDGLPRPAPDSLVLGRAPTSF